MTIEQRMDQLEKRNKRLTVGLTMMAVVVCAVVTMAAMDQKISTFDTVMARRIYVKNDAGQIIVGLSANDDDGGLVTTMSAKGKKLVDLNATDNDNGMVSTYQPNGKTLVMLGATTSGKGTVTTYQPNGKLLVELGASDNGGVVDVLNKTGESIANMYADEYGNGVVGAWNRKGKGKKLQPGP
jgi:hypothetical protein